MRQDRTKWPRCLLFLGWLLGLSPREIGTPSAVAAGDLACNKLEMTPGSYPKLQRKIEIQLQTTRLDHHNLQVTYYGYVEKVFTNLRRKLNRTEDDEMFDLKTNVLTWGLFMSTTMKSAIHLGLEYDENLNACQSKNL